MALIDCEVYEIPTIQARINQLTKLREELAGDKQKMKMKLN
jgi:hypothetical protein